MFILIGNDLIPGLNQDSPHFILLTANPRLLIDIKKLMIKQFYQGNTDAALHEYNALLKQATNTEKSKKMKQQWFKSVISHQLFTWR